MEAAGTIVTEQPPEDTSYVPCDGTYIEGWRYPDYRARVGGTLGSAGVGLLRLPLAPGYSVRLVDDPNAADPPADGFTADNPPPAYALWINPVADVTGSGSVTVVAEGHIEPITATCECIVLSIDESFIAPVAVDMDADGTLLLTADAVPVGDSYHFRLWVYGRSGITAQSNDLK